MGDVQAASGSGVRQRDPVVRFLGGCAVVGAVILVLLLGCAWLIGWRLTRDPAPGRKTEAFLTGDERRYWCVELRPDDPGLLAFFARLESINDEARRKAVSGTFLESIPLPHRRARLDQLAPLTLEGSQFREPGGWAVRGTFTRNVLRMRASIKLMQWIMSRDHEKATTFDVDGVAVTDVRDKGVEFALTNVGNRVLAASDSSRMRAMLEAPAESPHAALLARHGEVRLEGEDAWAFLANTEVESVPAPLSIAGAVASFDLNDRDELAFRVAVLSGTAVPEGNAFRGNRSECAAIVSSFLPMFDPEALEIDGEGADPGSRVFTGRVRGLSKYLPDLPKRLSAVIVRSVERAQRTPSAIPSPPSPPSSDDPRSGTRAEPPREGTPKPPR